MAFTKADGGGRDGVGSVYTWVLPNAVNAATLLLELAAVLPFRLTAEPQEGHIVTSTLAYDSGSIVQVRMNTGTAALSLEDEAAMNAAVMDHVA